MDTLQDNLCVMLRRRERRFYIALLQKIRMVYLQGAR